MPALVGGLWDVAFLDLEIVAEEFGEFFVGDAEGRAGFAGVHLGVHEKDADQEAAFFDQGSGCVAVAGAPFWRQGAEAGVLDDGVKGVFELEEVALDEAVCVLRVACLCALDGGGRDVEADGINAKRGEIDDVMAEAAAGDEDAAGELVARELVHERR